jgi:formylglycine-generating enzyme required for sulfatase activity
VFKARVGLASSNCGNPTWTDTAGANEDKPINCVNWYDAALFCAWDNARLPSEAEWNYAAAGGGQQRAFPWSVPASDTTLPAKAANVASGMVPIAGGITDHDGLWGHRDLAGGMFEWVFDANGTTDFGCSFPTLKGMDVYTATGSHPVEVDGVCRVLRGGSWKLQARFARTAARMALSPGNGGTLPDGGVVSDSYEDIGFRCARNVIE